jgi:superfamily II DNA or RNA helicase
MLRNYQLRACGEARVAWHRGYKKVLLVLATGLGKTEIFVHIADRWTKGRVLVVAPLIGLVGQAAKKIHKRTGEAPGIEQGNQSSDESQFLRSRFVVGSKQTLCGPGKRYRRLNDIGLVVIDEAHLALTAEFLEMVEWFVERGAVVLGLTATPKRGDKKALSQLFDVCPFQYHIAEGIAEGWLVPCRAQCVQLKNLDLRGVKTGATGDFVAKQLSKVLEQDKVVYEIADVTARESVGLKTAVFCESVLQARAVAELLEDQYRLKADWVCGDQRLCSEQRRGEVMKSFVGDPEGIQIVCNVGVLTLGWDFPALQHIVLARPTMSLSLFTQIFGRGTRALEGVVDFEIPAGARPHEAADMRRRAICASAKPWFKLTDLRDVSMNHKLISVVDVLGGKLGLAAKQIARGSFYGDGPREVDEVLLEAQRKAEEAEREKERRARARFAGRADYATIDVDPFNPYARSGGGTRPRSGPKMLFGKYKGQPVADMNTRYLEVFLEKVFFNARSQWFKAALERELAARRGGAIEEAVHEDSPPIEDVNAMLLQEEF